jgi:hypothetical protein
MRRIVVLLSVIAFAGSPTALAQQWTHPRHDPQLTGRAEMRGASGAVPRHAATLDLGGPAGQALLGDVDGDGSPDAAYVRGGHVAVTSTSGRTLFDRFLGATDLVAVEDLDGDRFAEVLFINRTTRFLGAVDVRAQALRWQATFPEYVTLDPAYVRVADVSSARAGLETIVFPDHAHTLGDARGYFFDARGAVYAQPVVKSWNGAQLHFPQLAVANVDGEGDPEVVVVGRPRLMVYSSNGGLLREEEFIAGDPEGRHYGALMVVNVDADPELEAIVVADRIPTPLPVPKRQAITVFDLAPRIRELWRAEPPVGEVFEAILGGAHDFDGDGRADLAVNHYDGATQVLKVYRGSGDPDRPGRPQLMCQRPDTFAWDAFDLNGDGRPELYASETRLPDPTLSYNSTLLVLRVEATPEGCRFDPVGDPIPTARYATVPTRVLGLPPSVGASGDDRSGIAVANIGGEPVFLTYSKAAGAGPRVQFRSVAERRTKVLEGGPRTGAVRAVDGGDLFLVAEGAGEEPTDTLAFYRWDASRGRLARLSEFRAGSFDAGSPLVADLDGDGSAELITRLPGRRIAAFALDAAGDRLDKLWEAEGNTDPVVDVAGTRPRDVRVYTTAPDRRDRAMLVARNGRGEPIWRLRFPELAANARPQLVLGEFTGAAPRDVWVSVGRNRSWMVDGADGRIVWTSTSVVHFSNRTAVRDQNGDGVDDLVLVSNATFGVYSGKDAKPIVGPKDVTSLGGELHATPIVAPDATVLLAGRGSIAKAAITGARVWSNRRATARVSGDLLPGVSANAQGNFERVGGSFGQSDQFVAFDYVDGRVAFATAHIAITDVNSGDTDGDGVDEFVFGTVDGRVVALRSDTGQEEWSIDVGGFAGTPILADLGGGGLDLVVPVGDGTLRVYSLAGR